MQIHKGEPNVKWIFRQIELGALEVRVNAGTVLNSPSTHPIAEMAD